MTRHSRRARSEGARREVPVDAAGKRSKKNSWRVNFELVVACRHREKKEPLFLTSPDASASPMVPSSEDEKAAAARRKRDAYFSTLAEEEKRGPKAKRRKPAGGDGVAKPFAAKPVVMIGLKKTSGIAMPSAAPSEGPVHTEETQKMSDTTTNTVGHTRPGATITGIPPPPTEAWDGDGTDELQSVKFVRFTAPRGANVSTKHARVQIRMGIRGTIAGPVVEVELPEKTKEGDVVEFQVPKWTANDAPPPPPKGSHYFRGSGAPPPPPGVVGVFSQGPPGPPPPPGPPGAPPPPPPRMVAMGGGAAAYGAQRGMRQILVAPPPPLPPVHALGIQRVRPPMTLIGGAPMGMVAGGGPPGGMRAMGAVRGASTVEVPPPPPPKKR